jgi:hypothetical protein
MRLKVTLRIENTEASLNSGSHQYDALIERKYISYRISSLEDHQGVLSTFTPFRPRLFFRTSHTRFYIQN